MEPGAYLFVFFAILVILNVPIFVSLGMAAALTIALTQIVLPQVVAQRVFTSLDSFPLMAIPFFMLAGNIMDSGGISRRLVNLANKLVGDVPGGLALVTILASMFFAAISGSSPATVAAIGSIMIPAMVKRGYSLEFASACQATSGTVGVILPPSIPMITYGIATGASIGGLFLAGFLPGIIVGSCLMIVAFIISRKRGYKGEARGSWREIFWAFKEAVWALLMPVIILGGIYGGAFTPTEAANVAVVYGLLVGFLVYRELKLKDLPRILRRSIVSSTIVMLIIAFASVFGLIMTREMIPIRIAEFVTDLTTNKLVFLLLVNILLLIVGTFMETNAAIIILAPIFLPIIAQLGIDPIHFGIIMVVNLAIGMITPPLGVNLFVACSMTKLSIERLVRANWWFFVAGLIAIIIITYWPKMVLFLPELFHMAR